MYNERSCDLYPSRNINALSDGMKVSAMYGSYGTKRGTVHSKSSCSLTKGVESDVHERLYRPELV
jgi:hypothetical protein